MNLRVTIGAVALASVVVALQPATAKADHDRHLRKHVHDAVHRVASVVLCPLEWFRHRHAEPAYKPAPQKVAYAKKVAAKKAYTPLK